MDDIWALNVGSITGPPYAIFGLKPALGPLTGNTKIKITGDGFKQSSNIVVRFLFSNVSPKGVVTEIYEDILADYVNEQTLSCSTPNFENYGPRKVDVFVSINKQDFTITKASYTYYLNTKADKTLAYGPGLLMDNSLHETMFIIQARNKDNKCRESGADEFVVKIVRPDKVKDIEDAG